MNILDVMQAFDLSHGHLNSLTFDEAVAIYRRKIALTDIESKKDYLNDMFQKLSEAKGWQTRR